MDGKLSRGETALGLKRQDPWLTKSNLHSFFFPQRKAKMAEVGGCGGKCGIFNTLEEKAKD